MAKVYVVIIQEESDSEWPYVWGTQVVGVYSTKENAELAQNRMLERNEKAVHILEKEVS